MSNLRAQLVSDAYERATALTLANSSAAGLRAGGNAYPEVWTRDAVISGLGMAAIGVPEARDLLVRSLRTLAAGQSRLGRIPNHVIAAQGSEPPELIEDTVFAGAVDSSLWFIIGHYVLIDSDEIDLVATWPHLEDAYRWLEYQDSNECGLLEVHESMDWADLFANRYNSLLPNVLWYAANRSMEYLADRMNLDGAAYAQRAEEIRFKINQLMWVGPEVRREPEWIRQNREEWLYPVQLIDTVLRARPYYLPYVAFRDYGDRLDTLGNLLAILFGLADDAQTTRILDHMVAVGIDQPWPVKACWPPVSPGERDWREYYRMYNLNQPHQYHNGGAWPFLGGFYVAALVRARRLEHANLNLTLLADMNRMHSGQVEWEFNEWFHGLSGKPMGHKWQSWSAGMYLYAHEAARRAEPPFFNTANGW